MITANQGAKLRGAEGIKTAADGLYDLVPLICMDKDDRDKIKQAINLLHEVFHCLIPNTPRGD